MTMVVGTNQSNPYIFIDGEGVIDVGRQQIFLTPSIPLPPHHVYMICFEGDWEGEGSLLLQLHDSTNPRPRGAIESVCRPILGCLRQRFRVDLTDTNVAPLQTFVHEVFGNPPPVRDIRLAFHANQWATIENWSITVDRLTK